MVSVTKEVLAEMPVLDDLLASLNSQERVRDICQGPFQTVVLTRRGGLAATPHGSNENHHLSSPVKNAGELIGRDASALAEMVYSDSENEAAIGMAALNSLVEVEPEAVKEVNAREVLLERGRGKKVALIGHFPFAGALQKATAKLWVIEKNPHEGDYPESETPQILPQADLVGITGTALTNHTIDELLKLCRKDAFVLMLGGSTPLSPILFEYGVDMLAGVIVEDGATAMRYAGQGATFRQMRGIRLVTLAK